MSKFKQYAGIVLAFTVLVVPMMLLDLLLSPIGTWTRLSNEIRRKATLSEINQLCAELEHDLQARRASKRSEFN